jgi:hypothetical protein
MTLLARRREDVAREPLPQAAVSERRGVVVRPREPQRGFLHVQGALGNHATGVLLRSGATTGAQPERPPGAPDRRSLASGGIGSLEASLLRAADSVSLAAAEPVAARPLPARVIVADGAPVRLDQMSRSRFLTALREAAREAAEQGLARTAHTARGCPWIEHYFRVYGRLAAERIEGDVRRYVPAGRTATSAEELLAHATAHVRESVRHWAATGELAGVPRGLPGMAVLEALGGSLAGVGRLVARDGVEGAPGGPPRQADVRDPAAVQAELGPGRPLAATPRSRMERAFGRSFSEVRVHDDAAAAGLARRLRARAFAVGPHVAFERGAYRPGTLVGDALLAHELAHVAQHSGRASSAPTPAGRTLDRDADGAAAGVVARLWLRGPGVPGLARPARPQLRAGLSLQRCGSPRSDRWFLPYRDRFNRLWNREPYRSMDIAFDPTLTSKGPRTARSREIFERLYLEDAELRAAYDEDKGGLRERVDTYTGPEGLNLIDSPRLKALEQAFARFRPPVSGRRYQDFKRAVAAAAGTLEDEDRQAINVSNEWHLQIGRYVRDADKRREIDLLINPKVEPSDAPAPPGTPEEELTQEQKVKRFFDRWWAGLLFKRGLDEPFFTEGEDVRYEDRRQLFRISCSSGIANPGQVLYVRVRVSRGSKVIASPDPAPFPVGQKRMPPIVIPLEAPAAVPAEGDALVFEVELVEGDLATVRRSRRFEMKVKEQTALTRQAAEKVAADDDRYLNDPTPPGVLERMREGGGITGRVAGVLEGVVKPRPSGLLGKMSARGGIPANVSESIRAGRLTLRALTERHDSGAFVTRKKRKPDPKLVGYFAGPTYGRGDSMSFVAEPADAFRQPDFGPRFIVVNRTPDLRNPERKRSDDGMIQMLVHEAVHALDVRPGENAPLERYKTEFRAYWMDGHLGPPLEGSCPEGERPRKCTERTGACLDTSYCAELPAPGPKTPRSRAIFDHLYGSPTYDFVKSNYDKNSRGFRRAVDQYVIPDGIDLIASIRLDDLRILIDRWNGLSFATLRSRVRAFVHPEGEIPPHGRLTEEEKGQVRGNRAWRNLVERKLKVAAARRQLKRDLGIPS